MQTDDWFLSGPQVQVQEIPDSLFYLDKLIPQEGIVMLHGKYGSYKTPITAHIAKAVATGSPLWDLKTTAARVLYIEGDTPRNIIMPRLQAMDVAVPNLDFAFVYPGIDVVNPHTPAWNHALLEKLATQHKQWPYGLIVVDSLRTSHQLADKDSESPPKVYGALARLFPAATFVLVHHDRKTRPPEKYARDIEEQLQDESFSGSQAWMNHATTGIHVRKHGRANKEWVTLHQHKSQASKELEDLDLQIKEGIHITAAVSITMDAIGHAIAIIAKWASWAELDKKLADHFDISTNWAKRHREEYEHSTGRGLPRRNG